MKVIFSICLLLAIFGISKSGKTMNTNNEISDTAKSDTTELSCKLTSKELQQRKETVIASLKQQVLETKELQNGFAFRFKSTDKILDELTEFVKSERQCCDFFTFTLIFPGDGSDAWLELTGPEGTKDFISTELGL